MTKGRPPRTLEDRIADLVVEDGDCLIWTGYVNPKSGYGQITLSAANQERLGSRTYMATAPWVVCCLTYGPPNGLRVLHSCDRKLCVAAKHLRWGTHSENMLDAYHRGQKSVGENHPRAKHSDAIIAEVRRRLADGETWKVVAKITGVSYSHVWKIAHGQRRLYPERGHQRQCLDDAS